MTTRLAPINVQTAGVHHVALRCTDLQQARVCYVARLGFTPLMAADDKNCALGERTVDGGVSPRHRFMRSLRVCFVTATLFVAKGAAAQVPTSFTNLGVINFNAAVSAPTPLQQDGGAFNLTAKQWYRFTLTSGGVTSSNGRFLDFYTTKDPTNTSDVNVTDTQIGLYDVLGNRIAFDDDAGEGFFSMLTFGGATARPYERGSAYGDFCPEGMRLSTCSGPGQVGPITGRNLAGVPGGALGNGDYFLAVNLFSGSPGASLTSNNQVRLKIGSGGDNAIVTPEPGTLALLALGLLPAMRLLRRKR